MTLRFEIIEDGEVVETRNLDRDVVKIGKLGSSHLKLEDSTVSRIHAVLEEGSDGGYSVIDLGSAEGTWVNGEKVTKSEVSDGDELRFGDVTVVVQFVDGGVEETAGTDTTGGGRGDQGTGGRDDRAAAAGVGGGEAFEGEKTVVHGGGNERGAGQASGAQADQTSGAQTGQTSGAQTGQTSGAQTDQTASAQTIVTDDGREVEPYTLEGYYDEGNNYIPGYYDENGQYHLGYGYYDEAGEWQVAYGYYNSDGEWVATDEPVSSAVGLGASGASRSDRPSDREEYTDAFFTDGGGDTLEVAHLWGDHVLRVDSFADPRTVTAGPSRDEDFIVGQDLVSDAHPLVHHRDRDGQYQLVVTRQMTGFVKNAGQEYTLREVIDKGIAQESPELDGYVLTIGPETSARVEWEGNVFLFHFTNMPAGIGGQVGWDMEPVPYFGISAAAHILFLLMAMSLPGDANDLSLDQMSQQDRFVEMMLNPEEEEKDEEVFEDKGDEEKAAKHKGEESKAGKKESEQKNKEMAVEGEPDNEDIKVKKERDRKIAMNAGANKVFQDSEVSSMFGSSSKSVGKSAITAMGEMDGSTAGESQGFGGFGVDGAGRGGGGGMNERGMGIGKVGTQGRGGSGRGGDGEYGEEAADMGDKEETQPEVVPQRPDVSGSLDRKIIRRVVRQNRREVKFCYEQELQRNPELSGRVTVKFTIQPSGDVMSAIVTKTTLNNTKVEQCIQGKVRNWVFPSPKGGGMVEVNYPFNFAAN